MQNSYRFFRNAACAYFPCHRSAGDPSRFNCLFCFCPLYWAMNCGGRYRILDNGLKDCSDCLYPHDPENYEAIIEKVGRLLNRKRFPEAGEKLR